MPEHQTPRQEFHNNVRLGRGRAGRGGASIFHRAFHRTVVDHWARAIEHTFVGPTWIEGQSIERQAEIICKALDVALELDRERLEGLMRDAV